MRIFPSSAESASITHFRLSKRKLLGHNMWVMWKGRFSKPTADLVQRYGESVSYDWRLFRQDIAGSIAHARAQLKAGLLSQEEFNAIESGLKDILKDIEAGNFSWSRELEDVHMNIESELTRRIGAPGAKLHTARSRNDQVATDTRLYCRAEIDEILGKVRHLQRALVMKAKEYADAMMPGYTHLQRAQPITFGHALMAYASMLLRDLDRFADATARMDSQCPLGSGALAGTTYPLDRDFTAEKLGFAAPCANSLDGVSDRDFCIELASAISICMMHLSRLSEEICLWSSTEFGFIDLDDAFATGSSMMPQKKNPDISELVRGKTGRTYGHLMALLTTLKGLPLAYNKDLQEDKEGFFDAVDTVKFSLTVFRDMLLTMTVNKDRMAEAVHKDYSNATDLADYLVKKGLPFRKAHKVVGEAVAYGIKHRKYLVELTLDEYKQFSPLFEKDLLEALRPENCVAARTSYGGPAPKENAKQLTLGRSLVDGQKKTLHELVTKR